MFVTLEGPEGAGKSTLARGLAERLAARGQRVVVTREPGAGEVGSRIREILLYGEDLPPATELFLFLADRAHHIARVVKPALERGEVVICDRHADSTYVYQGLVRGLDRDFVREANRFATDGLVPDLTLLLDLSAEEGLRRIKNPDRLDAEPLAFHRAVRAGFRTLVDDEPHRFRMIDAADEPEAVLEAALRVLVPRLWPAEQPELFSGV